MIQHKTPTFERHIKPWLALIGDLEIETQRRIRTSSEGKLLPHQNPPNCGDRRAKVGIQTVELCWFSPRLHENIAPKDILRFERKRGIGQSAGVVRFDMQQL